MIEKIKNLTKKSRFIRELYDYFYKQFQILISISPVDYFNFEKLKLFAKVWPYTMVGYKRLSNIYLLAETVEKNKIGGAFVECGVWRGGCVAVMADVSHKFKSNRKIWAFDSFKGLPEPTEKDGINAIRFALNRSSGKLVSINQCVASVEDVNKILFSILKLDKRNIFIEKGWFQETLPKAKSRIENIAILRVDCDWYESVRCCLDNLYDNLITGGYLIIDDYGHWEGCKKAVDEFLESRKIKVRLNKIDYTGVWFQKF